MPGAEAPIPVESEATTVDVDGGIEPIFEDKVEVKEEVEAISTYEDESDKSDIEEKPTIVLSG